MPGEQTAKVYEAITAYAVTIAIQRERLKNYTVEREVQLPNVSIRTDVMVYDSSHNPVAGYLVTHSNLEVDWQKKFKRDSAEVLEHVIAECPLGRLVLVIFDPGTLPGLEKMASVYFSDILRVSDIDSARELEKFGHDGSVCRQVSDSDDNSHQVIYDLVLQWSKEATFKIAFSNFVSRITSALVGKTTAHHSASSFFGLTGQMVSARKRSWTGFTPRHTRFKRALSKVAMLEEACWEPAVLSQQFRGQYSWATHAVFWQKPGTKKEKGPLCSIDIGKRYRCVDPEVIGGNVGNSRNGYSIAKIHNCIGMPQIVKAIKRGRQPMLPRYMDRIQNAPAVLGGAIKFIAADYRNLIKPRALGSLLVDCSHDPLGTFTSKCSQTAKKLDWHWAYSALVAIFKSAAGQKQGYGYSKIAKRMVTPSYRSAVQHSVLQHLEYGLRKLPEQLIREVGDAMAFQLKELTPAKIASLSEAAINLFIWCEVEDKVLTNGIDILPALIEIAAEDNSIALAKIGITSCLSDAVDAGGTAGRTNMYQVGRTLIWYKTAHYRQNVLHKRKEVQAVMAGCRQQWDDKSAKFVTNTQFDKAILVIDGDWLEEDLKSLYEFGWDHFIYPDELDRLPGLIV